MSRPLTNTTAVAINQDAGQHFNFWKTQLTGALKSISLPVDHLTSKKDVNESVFPEFNLSNEYSYKLNRLCYQYNTGLPILLLSAFKTLLCRYSGQTDLVVDYLNADYNVDGKNVNESVEKYLPIRANLEENPSFTELLQQVTEIVNVANDHKKSFEWLEEILTDPNNESFYFTPNVSFTFRNKVGAAQKSSKSSRNNRNTAKQRDLTLILESTSDGIKGIVEYNREIFEADTVSRIAEHYQVLLHEIISNPLQKIAQIRIMKEAELNKLLFEWNKTETAYPSGKCLHELFEDQAKKSPHAIAVSLYTKPVNFSGNQLTYNELNKKANQLAHYLQNIGVGPEVMVGIFMKRSLEMVVAILGVLKAGGAYLPLDANLPGERLDFILKDSGISILLSQQQLVNKLAVQETRLICLDTEWNKIAEHKDEDLFNQANPTNLAYVIYTSGSTGSPKGTLIAHNGVVNYLSWCINAYKVNEGNGCPVNSSIGFDATVTSFFSPLLTGKEVILLPEEGETEALADVLQLKNTFSLIKITPAHLEILSGLLSENDIEGQTNALVIGGEALTKKHLNLWHTHAPSTRLINEYGPTETVVGCCVYEVSGKTLLTNEIPIGRPIANTRIYILDRYMQPVPIGVTGEIYIGGAGVARGYLNRPELTAERFLNDPFCNTVGNQIYKTGDLACYLPDGNIRFLGRNDEQVKIRGYRVELGEIEHALHQFPSVKQAVVLAKKDKEGDKHLVSYFIPQPAAIKAKEHELSYQRVANWKELYETEYKKTEDDENINPEFNLIGWNDSFTGNEIPEEHMQEWLDDIVDVVLATQPQNILEIGCGTGLIYYRLAGKVKKYIGTDLSKSSINQIKERISKGLRNYGETELFTAPAHEVTLQEGQQIDTILLNSMVQYFPGEEYMNIVMEKCMSILKGCGRIIIGDVRDNRLLELFKGRQRIEKSSGSINVKEFKWAIEHDLNIEEELCFSPAYFYGLKEVYPQINHIEIQWKKGSYINELSLYRYTVIISVGIEKEQIAPQWQSWDVVTGNQTVFSNNGQAKDLIALRDIPNPRLWKERLLQKAMQNGTLKMLGGNIYSLEKEDEETVKLNQLLRIAETKGYFPKMLVHDDPLKINLLFETKPSQGFIQQPAFEKTANRDDVKTNIPLFTEISFLLQKEIRQLLTSRLPVYMLPTELLALRHLPLTTNGKIDRSALLIPEPHQQSPAKAFVGPRNKLEVELTKLFKQYLRHNNIGIHDDFFELGINSLQGYRIFAQIKKITGTQLPLSILLQAPTIEKLAAYLNNKESNKSWSCLVPIQPKGSKPPLYCIHAGGGTVLFYRELSRHLGADQPVYGLQLQGIDGMQEFHKSIEEMASHYINEIRAVNPEGPYLLGGFCFGAVVAFEMAQQLVSRGYKVAMLANFNGVSPTYINTSGNNVDIEENVAIAGQLLPAQVPAARSWKMIAQKIKAESFSSLSKKVQNRIFHIFKSKASTYKYYISKAYILGLVILYKSCLGLKVKPPKALKKYHFVFTNSDMVKSYKPKPYPGRMSIFRSPEIFRDPHLGWSNYVTGEIETLDIPGHHSIIRQIMNEPFVESTAKELNAQIEKYKHLHTLKEINNYK